jgi:hypothetical protein
MSWKRGSGSDFLNMRAAGERRVATGEHPPRLALHAVH